MNINIVKNNNKMANCKETNLTIFDITKCSICLETFSEPKVLPCVHTFCFQCLNKYCANKNEMSCPICRRAFFLPAGGVKDLPHNFFMDQLLQVNKLAVKSTTGEDGSDKPSSCDLCSDSEVEIASTSYCLDCGQHMCDRCSVAHVKMKLTKSHKIVANEDMPSISEERLKSNVSYCDEHPNESNTLYCYDCKMIMCYKCVSKHSQLQHKIADVGESAEKFCEILKHDVKKVSAFVNTKSKEIVTRLEAEKTCFIDSVTSSKNEISQRYDQLLSLILSQKNDLTEALDRVKDDVAKEMENEIDEIEMQSVLGGNFVRYCQEMTTKGRYCDISRVGQQLHVRAEELVKKQNESDNHKAKTVEVKFKPSFSTTDNVTNFIGELVSTDYDDKTYLIKDILKPEFTAFLKEQADSEVTSSMKQAISGLTILGSELFFVHGSSELEVHKSDDLSFVRRFEIPASSSLCGICSCSRYNCIYASDFVQKVIFRYEIANSVTTNWFAGGNCCGLSLTKRFNVLVTINDSGRIEEYTGQGILIRTIDLPDSVEHPCQCIQLPTSGEYVVCHNGALHSVCVVNKSGQLLHTYSGNRRLKPGVRSTSTLPNLMTTRIDDNEKVIVVDRSMRRIQFLSPTLKCVDVTDISKNPLQQLYALYFDKQTQNLYFGRGASFVVLHIE